MRAVEESIYGKEISWFVLNYNLTRVMKVSPILVVERMAATCILGYLKVLLLHKG